MKELWEKYPNMRLFSDGESINYICPICKLDEWTMIDSPDEYIECCNRCGYKKNHITKQDFVNNFECPECGSLSGKLEENDVKLGVRCNNCGKLHIMLEKHTTVNHRNVKPVINDNTPKCPKCNSTNIQIVPRKWSLLGGFATKKTDRVCVNCKHKW